MKQIRKRLTPTEAAIIDGVRDGSVKIESKVEKNPIVTGKQLIYARSSNSPL